MISHTGKTLCGVHVLVIFMCMHDMHCMCSTLCAASGLSHEHMYMLIRYVISSKCTSLRCVGKYGVVFTDVALPFVWGRTRPVSSLYGKYGWGSVVGRLHYHLTGGEPAGLFPVW